ncbi:MAG: CGNR zinc finger domain-containing protein [Solirubrobacteraceae bacterium]
MAHKQQNAPGDLEAVRAFVNTVDLEDGAEELSDPPSLVRWLADHELIEPGTEATKADVRNAIAVREALRRQLLANNGADVDAASVDTLRAAARRARIGLDFRADGTHLEPQAGGVDGALGRLLGRVHAAQHEGTWARLKACPWHTCHYAFYDHTKNRSGVWCTMEVCGNRAKAKAYRERHG